MNRRLTRLLTVPVVALGAAGAAWGFWSADIAPGAHGAAAATVVDDGSTPTATAVDRSVTVRWTPTALGDGTPVTGYKVRRYDAETGAEQTLGSGCSGTVTAATCTETLVADGRWSYTVTPVVGTSWQGAPSAESVPVVVDDTPPTGGAITANGLVGEGAAYSTSTNLTLALTPATDPNGIAAGAQVQQLRRQTLSNGTCSGTYALVKTITVGSAVSVADTVGTDGRCYQYKYVVKDTFGNQAEFTSADVKVDTTPPGAGLSPAAVSASSHVSGTTVYYRPTTSGSFRVTPAGDLQSGISAYTYPDLGLGWTAPGNAGSQTYAWTATSAPAPATPLTVTTTNRAGLSTVSNSFTMVPDPDAPTGGTLTYRDGFSTADHVYLTWTEGTDSGSGIAPAATSSAANRVRVLQRATAVLSPEGTCGAFGAFKDIVNGVDPTPVRRDPVRPGSCYKYQLLVKDNVGNVAITPGTSIVKVIDSGYAKTVKGTAGLAGYWRLGEATSAADSFTGAAGTRLSGRSGESGPSWVRHWDTTSPDAVLTSAGRLRRNDAGGVFTGTIHTVSVDQDDPDYTVEADLHVASLANDAARLVGRFVNTNNELSMIAAGYDQGSESWQLVNLRFVSGSTDPGTTVPLATVHEPLAPGTVRHLALEMRGSQVRLLVDGVERLTAVDTNVRVGTAGLAMGYGYSGNETILPPPSAPGSDTTGIHVDNYRVTPSVRRDSDALLSDGHYLRGATTGIAGAPADDENTAISLDGTDDEVRVSTSLTEDLSLELFFRSGSGVGGGESWTTGAPIAHVDTAGTDDLGVSLSADGHVVAGLGSTSVASALGGYADGDWHHLVLTRDGTTGELALHVDGADVRSVPGPTTPVAGPASLVLGLGLGGTRFTGALDELALYGRALTPEEVAMHHLAAQPVAVPPAP